MASVSQQAIARPVPGILGRNGLIDRYFYFLLALVVAVVIAAGFSKTVGPGLIHATPGRPVLLWLHGAAFSAWVVFFILQSGLVRIRKVSWHRTLGWFGAALAALMVVLGFVVSVVMGRFDALVMHQPDPAFLSVTFWDMLAFGTLVGLAILWRGKPELHRRFLVLATCGLLDAGFGRFAYIFNHNLFYLCLDGVILLGVVRDLLVDRRAHKVYLYALPGLVLGQNVAIYLWRHPPGWWLSMCKETLEFEGSAIPDLRIETWDASHLSREVLNCYRLKFTTAVPQPTFSIQTFCTPGVSGSRSWVDTIIFPVNDSSFPSPAR
jgi:hypothetical protein